MSAAIQQRITDLEAQLVQLHSDLNSDKEKELDEKRKADRSRASLVRALCAQHPRLPIERLHPEGLALNEPIIKILFSEKLGCSNGHGDQLKTTTNSHYQVRINTIPHADWKDVVDGPATIATEKIVKYISCFLSLGEVETEDYV